MADYYQIQPAIFCEPCKDCGARPVIQQTKDKFVVLCPNDKDHYKTKPGLIDIKDWNLKNKKQIPFVNTVPAQKAS
jgi:hypothetical protein